MQRVSTLKLDFLDLKNYFKNNLLWKSTKQPLLAAKLAI
jgi:hypothetical protein